MHVLIIKITMIIARGSIMSIFRVTCRLLFMGYTVTTVRARHLVRKIVLMISSKWLYRVTVDITALCL